MSNDVPRREFLAAVAAAQGALVLGFWMPDKAQAQTPGAKPSGAVWYEDPATPEVNAWPEEPTIDRDDRHRTPRRIATRARKHPSGR